MKKIRRAIPKKAVAAVTIVLATFIALSAPASADPPYVFSTGEPGSSGMFIIHSQTMAPDLEFDVSVDDECPVPASFGIFLNMGPAISGMAQTLAVNAGGLLYATAGGTLYGVEVGIADPNVVIGANNSGTIAVNSPPPHTLTQNLWLIFDIFEITDAPTCNEVELLCTLVLAFDSTNSSPLVGDYTGTIYPTSPATIDNLTGTGVAVPYGPCDSSISTPFQDAPVTVTDLDLAH